MCNDDKSVDVKSQHPAKTVQGAYFNLGIALDKTSTWSRKKLLKDARQLLVKFLDS